MHAYGKWIVVSALVCGLLATVAWTQDRDRPERVERRGRGDVERPEARRDRDRDDERGQRQGPEIRVVVMRHQPVHAAVETLEQLFDQEVFDDARKHLAIAVNEPGNALVLVGPEELVNHIEGLLEDLDRAAAEQRELQEEREDEARQRQRQWDREMREMGGDVRGDMREREEIERHEMREREEMERRERMGDRPLRQRPYMRDFWQEFQRGRPRLRLQQRFPDLPDRDRMMEQFRNELREDTERWLGPRDPEPAEDVRRRGHADRDQPGPRIEMRRRLRDNPDADRRDREPRRGAAPRDDRARRDDASGDPRPLRRRAESAWQPAPKAMAGVPGLRPLLNKDVQNELKLRPEQREKITNALKRAYEESRRLRAEGKPGVEPLKAAMEFIMGTLGPEQRTRLKEILRHRAPHDE